MRKRERERKRETEVGRGVSLKEDEVREVA